MDKINDNCNCELVFYKTYEKNQKEILKFLNTKKNYRIITNSKNVKTLANDNNINCQFFEEIIPNENNEKIEEVYAELKENIMLYSKIFENFEFYGREIFFVLKYTLLKQFLHLFRIKKILSDKKDTVLFFEGLSTIHQIIPEVLKELNYSMPLVFFIDNGLNKTNFEQLNLETKQISKINKIIKPILTQNDFKLNFLLFMKLGFRYIKLIFEKNTLSQKSLNIDDIIIKKLNNKLLNIKNLDCLFFLTASREDVFLKPVYSILNELDLQKKNYQIMTSDVTTGINLSNKNISHLDIFETVQIISKHLESDQIGKNIKNIIHEKLPHVKPLGYKIIESFLIKETLRSFALLKICKYIIEQTNPNSILVSDDGEILGNSAISVSKKNKITSFALITNLMNNAPIFTDWFHADKIFTYGYHGKKLLNHLNYNSDRIIVTGNPRNENIYQINKNEIHNQISKKFHIDANKKIILLAQSLWHDNDEIWIAKLINFCEKNSLELIIKIHPRYRIRANEYSKTKIEKIKKLSNKDSLKFSYDYDFSLLASCSEVVITDFSYAGIEAILQKKPVILVNFMNNPKFDVVRECLNKSKMTDEAINYEELESMLKKVLKNEFLPEKIDLENEIEEFDFKHDGNASKRIVNYLIK